jgi:hypothetical protein
LEAVVKAGALRTIITYAFPSTDTSANVQFQAVAALRGLGDKRIFILQFIVLSIVFVVSDSVASLWSFLDISTAY